MSAVLVLCAVRCCAVATPSCSLPACIWQNTASGVLHSRTDQQPLHLCRVVPGSPAQACVLELLSCTYHPKQAGYIGALAQLYNCGHGLQLEVVRSHQLACRCGCQAAGQGNMPAQYTLVSAMCCSVSDAAREVQLHAGKRPCLTGLLREHMLERLASRPQLHAQSTCTSVCLLYL